MSIARSLTSTDFLRVMHACGVFERYYLCFKILVNIADYIWTLSVIQMFIMNI